MKTFFLILFVVAFATVYGQVVESGKVVYETVTKFSFGNTDDLPDEVKNMMPGERKSHNELSFDKEKSLYQNLKSASDDTSIDQDLGGGNQVTIEIKAPENYFYNDLDSKTIIESREFMGRRFLINYTTDTIKWKITPEQKDIAGYNCIAAELVGGEETVKAWFAPTIPVQAGPEGYAGLPGLILAVESGNGDRSICAQKIKAGNIDAKTLKKPKKGKKVTLAEFNQIKDEKMKEMESANGGSMIIIKTEN